MAKCCAPNCSNNQRKDSVGFSFYEFPEDPNLRGKWISNIGRLNWTPGRRSMLCSAHFEISQFKRDGKQLYLHDAAIPTLFQLSGRKKGNPCKTKPVSDLKENVTLGERKSNKPINKEICNDHNDKSQECQDGDSVEAHDTLSGISSISSEHQVSAFKEKKFVDEYVLIDSNYIVQDSQLIDDTQSTQISSDGLRNFVESEECVPMSDSSVKDQESSGSPSFSSDFICKVEDEQQPGTVMIVKSDTPGEIVLLQETFPLLSDNVMYIQQSSTQLETMHSQPINPSDSATCSTGAESASSHFSVFQGASVVDTATEIDPLFVPLKNGKLTESNEETNKSAKPSVPQTLCRLPFFEKSVTELPLSFENHFLYEQLAGSHGPTSLEWQKGTFMCRLCGYASKNTLNLFGAQANQMKLLERISSILPIMIVQSDELPQSVCSECLSRLDTCSKLIVTSFNTHRQLASVMGQDIKTSLTMPAYLQGRDKIALHGSHYKRSILLMEIFQDEDEPLEKCLTVAYQDLCLRLQSECINDIEPQCSLVLVPLNDGCGISYVEQVRTAAEALISKTIPDEGSICNEDVAITTGEPVDEQICEVERTSNYKDIFFEQDFNETSPEMVFEDDTTILENAVADRTQLSELSEPYELDVMDVHAMPVTDDISPYDFLPADSRCPKLEGVWQGKEIMMKNMQKIFRWDTFDNNVAIFCILCKGHINRSGVKNHLKKHLDVSCNLCSYLLPSQQDRDSHKCDPKTLPKVWKLGQSLSPKVFNPLRRRGLHSWFQCSFCSKRFTSKTNLEQHLQQLHADNAKCIGCGFDASNVFEAAIHRQMCATLKKQKEWQCRKCLEIFLTEDELMKHQVTSGHDNKMTSWLCDVCGKKFSQAAKLSQHKKIHLPPEFKFLHQCPHCPKRYINSSRLKEHMQNHEEKKYMCKVCGKLFGTRQILKQHEFTHGDPQFLCSICSKTFFRKSHLLKHMNVHSHGNSRANRSGPQPHRDGLNRCRECKAVFDQKELLSHYKTSHPHVQLQHYVCEICKEENTSYAELFQHQREAHKTGVKDCPFCEKTIDSSTQMKYHLMRHEGMFPYNCPLCSNGYTANSILQDHIRRKHTGEKPFECTQCSKRFPTSGALAQHNTVHSLPHQLLPCPFCNQGFKRKAHLDVHIRTHTGEKPYPCPVCQRPFRQRPDCVKHIRVIHGQDPSNFNIRYHPNTHIEFPQVVSVADMELVLEGEDLMQASFEDDQIIVSQ